MAAAIRAVTMPKWGIEMTEGTINQWSIGEGQHVEKGAPLLEVETEKIVNTVEAPAAGTLRRIIAMPGDVKPVGALIAVLADPGVSDEEVTSFIESFKGASVSFEPDAVGSADVPGPQGVGAAQTLRISPIARRLAESLGIDLAEVKGAGRGGRITKEDVEAYVATRTAGGPLANPATRQKMSSMRATIARRMLEAKQTIPHYRLAMDVEMDRLLQQRRALMEQTGTRISLNDMLLRACALALVAHPTLNAQLDGEEVVTFSHADIAIAVATDGGLITPVLRRADLKPLAQIASETVDLIGRARRSALTREEISGGTFTLSNLGSYGLTRFDAIINAPQVAILAVGAARECIVARNRAPATAQLMTLTLSADHRVVDGARGAAFLNTLKELIQAPERL